VKKLQEQEKRQKVEFRKRMEQEVSAFIQASGEPRRRFQPMTKIERSILHDVAEVAGLTSFSFGDDEDSRYVMVFKKEFAPSDEELEDILSFANAAGALTTTKSGAIPAMPCLDEIIACQHTLPLLQAD